MTSVEHRPVKKATVKISNIFHNKTQHCNSSKWKMCLKSFHEKKKCRQEKGVTRLHKKNILSEKTKTFLIGVGKIFR